MGGRDALVGYVGRIPAPVRTKLLAAFLLVELLLVALGRREQRARHDAFDPSQHPNAPGAPRPLGTIRSKAPANKGSADYAYGQPAN